MVVESKIETTWNLKICMFTFFIIIKFGGKYKYQSLDNPKNNYIYIEYNFACIIYFQYYMRDYCIYLVFCAKNER